MPTDTQAVGWTYFAPASTAVTYILPQGNVTLTRVDS